MTFLGKKYEKQNNQIPRLAGIFRMDGLFSYWKR
jgi:hypothetical protein